MVSIYSGQPLAIHQLWDYFWSYIKRTLWKMSDFLEGIQQKKRDLIKSMSVCKTGKTQDNLIKTQSL